MATGTVALTPRRLPLDIDAFEGPFDLLLTLVLKQELELADVQVFEIVATFVARYARPSEDGESYVLDLDAGGEFLVLVAALLELKARELFPDNPEIGLDDLDPEDAAAELAARLAEYRRVKEGADWLRERLEEEATRFFRVGPAPLAPKPPRELARQEPALLAQAMRGLAEEPPQLSLNHLQLKLPPTELFLERFRALLSGRRRFVFDEEVDELSRIEQAVALVALLELGKSGEAKLGQSAHLEPIVVWGGKR
jgi:segregation and condensation protein A